MAKKKSGGKLNINGTRMIKIGSIVVFALFAGILAYVSLFIWNTLGNIGGESNVSNGTNVQGINESMLNDIESSLENEALDGEVDEYARNPFMPVGMQVPNPPEPEPVSEPPADDSATIAGNEDSAGENPAEQPEPEPINPTEPPNQP